MQPAPGTGQVARRVVPIDAFGVPVTVRVGGSRAAELEAELARAWAWCAGAGSSAEPLLVDAALDDDEEAMAAAREEGVLAGTDLRAVMEWLSSAVTTTAITARAGRLLMLHGCAVADPASGATAVLVGPSGAGKTTAATALGTRFGYVTDETVAIREDLSVLAYPKPLSVRRGEQLVGKVQRSPAELGLLPPVAGLRAAAVILLDRSDTGPDLPEVEPVPTVQALAWLGEQSSFLADLPRPLQRLAALADAVGGVRRVRYRESAALLGVVETALGTAP